MEFEDIQICVDELLNFLRGSISKYEAKAEGDVFSDWHVIFKGGTIARIDFSIHTDEFNVYDDTYRDGYPMHRVSEDVFESILSTNIKVWESQKNLYDGDKGRVLCTAYKILINDGYPYPGGEGSDRVPLPITDPSLYEKGEAMFLIFWPYRDIYLFNVVNGTANIATALGGELRRLDYMMPKVYAIVDPQGEVTYIN